MDGFQNPGTSIVASMSPSTLNSGHTLKDAPAQSSDMEKLVQQLAKSNELMMQQHQNFRSEADRKIQDLTQRNQLLSVELQKTMATNADLQQPKAGNNVDSLWNGFLTGNQQTQQTEQSTEPVTAAGVQKIVADTLTKTQQAAAEFNQNNAEIEQAIFQKFVQDHPDLVQHRRNEVLALWQGAAEANPAFAHNPAARYEYTIRQARKLFPKRDGVSLGGESAPPQGGGTGVQQRKGDSSFQAMAQTEHEKEQKRFNELNDYVTKRKRQFGERTGFPYGELES